MTKVPEGMTAEKLRWIADWLDTYDNMAEKILGVGEMTPDRMKTLTAIRGKEVQADLRQWADAIETP